MSNKLFEQAKFDFVGSLMVGKEAITTSKSDKSVWSKTRGNFGIKDGANGQYVNLEYLHRPDLTTCKIYTVNDKLEEFALADTTNPSVLAQAADFVKITVDLETDFEKKKEYTSLIYKVRNHETENRKLTNQGNLTAEDKEKIAENNAKITEYNAKISELATMRKQFCHAKDVIAFMEKAAPALADKKLRMVGNVKSNFYNGKNNLQYIPNFIEIVPDETDNKLLVTTEIFYDKTSLTDDKKAQKIIIDGYIGDKVKKADKLFPIQAVIDYSKLDTANPQELAMFEFLKNSFKVENKKRVYKNNVEINILNGSEKVEFDESCLTEQQKIAVMLGYAKLEEFKPKGTVYGNRVRELRIARPILKGDYANGALEAFDLKELDMYMKADDSDVTVSDVKSNPVETPVVQETTNVQPEPAQSAQDIMKGLFNN